MDDCGVRPGSRRIHGRDFAVAGGVLQMVQLWVSLTARQKTSPPRYQSILNSQIPTVGLPDGQGSVRVIAGEFEGSTGPARTFTPIDLWDMRLTSEQPIHLPVPEGYNTLLVVLKGSVYVNSSETIDAAYIRFIFDRTGDHIRIDNPRTGTVLLLAGEPINEPIVGSGPFVMNNDEEIRQAILDYQNGKMGSMP